MSTLRVDLFRVSGPQCDSLVTHFLVDKVLFFIMMWWKECLVSIIFSLPITINLCSCTSGHGQWSGHWWFAPGVSYLLWSMFTIHALANCASLACSSQYRRLVQQRPCHVLSNVCGIACKRSTAICRKSRAFCPVSRLLSVPIYSLHVLNRGVHII